MTVACSLLLLTYNQERFVADAVRAALAQEGPAIEVLISDDASTDASFDIARTLAEQYTGPHQVVLNRNPRNMGVVAHTNQAVDRARGDILIPAYGDDVSFPNRADTIVQAFRDHDPLLVHSHARAIDADGQPTATDYQKADFFRTTRPIDVATSLSHYLGASGGWSRSLFETYGPLVGTRVYDDHILGFRAALEGRVHLIEDPLLFYRDGVGISHLAGAAGDRQRNRARRIKILTQSLEVFQGRLQDARRFGLPEDDAVVARLRNAIIRQAARLSYYDGGAAVLRQVSRHAMIAPAALASEALRDIRRR